MHSWGPGPIPGDDEPRRRRRRDGWGGEMDAVLEILRTEGQLDNAIDEVHQLYPHVDAKTLSSFVYDARRALHRGDRAQAERLTHAFLVGPRRRPDADPEPRPSLWSRLWPWLAFVYIPAAALLVGVEVWK